MSEDIIILGQDCILEGKVGATRPNDNVIVVGPTGGGKSMSIAYPTMLYMQTASSFANFSKRNDALRMAVDYRRRGYKVMVCDLDHPDKSDVFFDPNKYIASYDDISSMSAQIVHSVLKKTNDDYWNGKAIPLLSGLHAASNMTKDDASYADVLDLFDDLSVEECGSGITTGLDGVFRTIKTHDPHCFAAREFYSFRMLPIKTAACVRDTLAAALSNVFPEGIRKAIREKPSIDFIRMAREKTALFIICSPVNRSAHPFANLLYDTAIKVLLNYSQECVDGKLPIPVKFFFDDMACSAPVLAFPQQISIFRSAGINVMLLLQSESQLRSTYGEDDATTIINNCSTYVFFPGGADLRTCRNVSERMNIPLEDVLYAPIGKVFIMQAGRKPIIVPRYDILNDPRYMQMMKGRPNTEPKPLDRRE